MHSAFVAPNSMHVHPSTATHACVCCQHMHVSAANTCMWVLLTGVATARDTRTAALPHLWQYTRRPPPGHRPKSAAASCSRPANDSAADAGGPAFPDPSALAGVAIKENEAQSELGNRNDHRVSSPAGRRRLLTALNGPLAHWMAGLPAGDLWTSTTTTCGCLLVCGCWLVWQSGHQYTLWVCN